MAPRHRWPLGSEGPVTTIDGWECQELWEGHEWAMRVAKRGTIELQANVDGLDLEESCHGYGGATGRYSVPANVLMWLAAGVR